MWYFTVFMLLMTLIFQIQNSQYFLEHPKPIFSYMIAIQWTAYLFIFIILALTIIFPKKIWLINFMFFFGFLRSIMPFFDGDERRFRNDKSQNAVFLSFTTISVLFIVLIHNLINSNYCIMLIECNIAIFCIYWGALRLTIPDKILDYIVANSKN